MTELDTFPQRLHIWQHNRNAINQVIRCVEDGRYCALLGPRFSGKTELLNFVKEVLAQDPTWVCVYLNLQDVEASTLTRFFASLTEVTAQRISELTGCKLVIPVPEAANNLTFRTFLREGVTGLKRDLVLMVDHLEAVPNDLIQILLTSLRAAYMEQQPDEYRLVAVVSGALSLATLTVGESSPFRGIAHRVFVGDLTDDESEALITEHITADGVKASPVARAWLLRASRGDPHLIVRICQRCMQIAGQNPSHQLRVSTVKRVMSEFIRDEALHYGPLQEAVRLIEDDPDLLRCIVLLLERRVVPKRELPLPLSPDLDPLYLTGMVRKVLKEDSYQLRNEIYRQFLTEYFHPGRVGHLLTMAGRWDSAIDYLEASIEAGNDQYRSGLLAATINSMYASEEVERAAAYLIRGLSTAFDIEKVRIWYVSPDGNIRRSVGQQGLTDDNQATPTYDDQLEARVYREARPLRGQEGHNYVKRALPLLIPGRKPVGIVTIFDRLDHDELAGQRERDLQMMGYLNQAARAFQELNERQYQREQEQRRLELAETLREISTVIGGSLDLEKVLTLILEQMGRVLPFDTASIQLLTPGRNALKIIAYKGVDDPSSAETRTFPLEDIYPNVRVWRCKKPLRYSDVRGVFPQFTDPKYQTTRIRAWLGAPLLVRDEAIGVITLDSFTADFYTSEHEHLAMIFASQAAVAIENARLFEETKRRAADLETLAEVAEEISATITGHPPKVLELVLRGACRLTGADCSVIYPFLPGKLVYDKANIATFGLLHPELFAPKDKHRLEDTSLARSIVDRNIRVVHNVMADPDRGLPHAPFIQRESIRAFVGISLRAGNEPLGVLFVNFRQPHEFTGEELETIGRFANQTAFAILNARLYRRAYDDLQQHVAELETIQDIDDAITSTLDLHEILEMILDRTLQLTGATCGYVQLVSDDAQELVLAIVRGTPSVSIGDRLRLGQGVTGMAAQQGRTYRISDLLSPEWAHLYRAYIPGMRSQLAVPMRFEGQVVGVINIESADVNAFSQDNERLLEGLAKQAAIAIRNAKRYEELEKTKDYLLASQVVAWLGLFGADWQHTINQKTFSIGNYANGLRRWLTRQEVPPDIINEVFQALERIEKVAESIRSVQFTSQVPPQMPGEINGQTLIDQELPDMVDRWGSSREDVDKILNLNCPGVRVAIAPQWLKVAMEKLINNALKAMPSGGRLTVATRLRGDTVHIILKDTGHGIPDSVRAYFLKQVVPRDKEGVGTGMGAMIARFVALSHGGELNLVRSRPNEGTELLMKLPVATDKNEGPDNDGDE